MGLLIFVMLEYLNRFEIFNMFQFPLFKGKMIKFHQWDVEMQTSSCLG